MPNFVSHLLTTRFLSDEKSRNEILVCEFSRYKFEAGIDCLLQRLTSSMHMHPLPALLNNGVPVVLSSDDPSVFGNMGLTFDYFQVRVIYIC